MGDDGGDGKGDDDGGGDSDGWRGRCLDLGIGEEGCPSVA